MTVVGGVTLRGRDWYQAVAAKPAAASVKAAVCHRVRAVGTGELGNPSSSGTTECRTPSTATTNGMAQAVATRLSTVRRPPTGRTSCRCRSAHARADGHGDRLHGHDAEIVWRPSCRREPPVAIEDPGDRQALRRRGPAGDAHVGPPQRRCRTHKLDAVAQRRHLARSTKGDSGHDTDSRSPHQYLAAWPSSCSSSFVWADQTAHEESKEQS